MEEESEKRRERLRAMRSEAENAGDSSSFVATALPCSLSNPLTETPLLEDPRPSSARFGFYTRPMSAFSTGANPQMPSESFPLPGPRNTEMTSQAHQYQGRPHQYRGNYVPGQQMYQPRGRGHSPIPHRNPMGRTSRPYNTHQGNQNYPIRPGSAAGYNYNPPLHPGFSPTGSPFNAGQGRGYWVNNNNSPSPGPGHGGWGRHHGGSANPGPGWRGGRGRCSSGGSSGAERFYNESMIEDPWKFLEPVIWTEVRAPDLSKSWAPSPLGTKKA